MLGYAETSGNNEVVCSMRVASAYIDVDTRHEADDEQISKGQDQYRYYISHGGNKMYSHLI